MGITEVARKHKTRLYKTVESTLRQGPNRGNEPAEDEDAVLPWNMRQSGVAQNLKVQRLWM
jgi:hypothetical protein